MEGRGGGRPGQAQGGGAGGTRDIVRLGVLAEKHWDRGGGPGGEQGTPGTGTGAWAGHGHQWRDGGRRDRHRARGWGAGTGEGAGSGAGTPGTDPGAEWGAPGTGNGDRVGRGHKWRGWGARA